MRMQRGSAKGQSRMAVLSSVVCSRTAHTLCNQAERLSSTQRLGVIDRLPHAFMYRHELPRIHNGGARHCECSETMWLCMNLSDVPLQAVNLCDTAVNTCSLVPETRSSCGDNTIVVYSGFINLELSC